MIVAELRIPPELRDKIVPRLDALLVEFEQNGLSLVYA